MNSDTRYQLKVVLYFQVVALAFLAIHLWPEAEASPSICDETVYYLPNEYRMVGFESIAHYGHGLDKISDELAVNEPPFHEKQLGLPSFHEPLWLHHWVIDARQKAGSGKCANQISEPGVLWLAALGLAAMVVTRRKA